MNPNSIDDFVISNVKYPWNFDESTDLNFCVTQFLSANNFGPIAFFQMELKSLAAGILQIYDEANDVTPIYKFTPEQSNIVFHFTATIIKFIFCPDIQSNQSKGFVLNGKFLQAFGPTGEIRCDHNMIELSDSLPIIAINAKVFSIHPIFCLILTQENITEMLIMIEICDFEPIPTFPFLIDDEPPKTGNCTKKINLGKYTQFCCTTKQRIQKGKPLSLKIVGDPEKNASNRTLVFRKARAIDEKINVIALNNVSAGFNFPSDPDKDTAFILSTASLFQDDYYSRLFSFREARSTLECSYALYLGARIPTDSSIEERVAIFRDSDAFEAQRIPPQAITIHIPKGCSPAIGLRRETAVDNSSQILCEGFGLAIGPGYGDPFHPTINKNNDFQGFWKCDAESVNVVVEVIDILTGNLSITIFDKFSIVSNGSIFFSTSNFTNPGAPFKPKNFSYSAVQSVKIDWLGVADSAPIGQPNGFLAKVHFERILPPPRPPASTQALPKTNTANGFSINLWLLKCIICYFMSVG